jgi:hypothetical protein
VRLDIELAANHVEKFISTPSIANGDQRKLSFPAKFRRPQPGSKRM